MRAHLLWASKRLSVAALCTAAMVAAPTAARAESRHALLVGIDKYVPPAATPSETDRPTAVTVATTASSTARSRGAWSNLDGAVNDVEELRQILIARYGFAAADIHVLHDAEATRARVLSEIRSWLAAGDPGDVRVFVYAGHGSQVRNSLSEEADKLDESIVPADANTGVPDIRDKELATEFDAILAKHLLLTVLFDSCHSGSIARGAPRLTRFRFIEPDTRDVADPSRPPAPETRGALVLSAAQDYQLAAETRDEENRPHGLFSWALLKTLRSMPVNQSADRVFLQIRALMQAGDVAQEPVLAATPERRRLPLFGTGTAGPGGTVVAVQQIEPDGSVILQGGLAAGIRQGTELQHSGIAAKIPLRLRVVDDPDLAHSRAIAPEGGDTKGLEPGALFEVVRWKAAAAPALHVWIGPSTLPVSTLRREAATLRTLLAAPGLSIIEDPTTATDGTNVLQWNGTGWQVSSQAAPPQAIEPDPTAAKLLPLLANTAAGSRLMVSVPLPQEVATRLGIGAGTKNDTIEVVPSQERADYLLMGRVRGDALEYAWVRPLATNTQQVSTLPARTDWLALDDNAPGALADRLRALAQRLAVLRGWLQLESPADSGRFPYHLAIRDAATKEIRTSGPTRDGESYDLVLARDEAMARDVFDRRFVYVFAIDSAGSSTLLFPRGAAGAVENRLPIALPDSTEPPKEITLGGFRVGPPFGVDTFMLLTSVTQLADPTVLEGEAVRRVESTRGSADPLTRLLAQQRSTTRGAATLTPPTWSLERLSILSVPATPDRRDRNEGGSPREQQGGRTSADQLLLIARRLSAEAEAEAAKDTPEGKRLAIEKYDQALVLYRQLGRTGDQALTLTWRGHAFRALNRENDAQQSYEQALALRRTMKDRAGEADALDDLGTNYWFNHRFEQAVAAYESALAIHRELSDRPGEARTLEWLGSSYRNLRQLAPAIHCYEQALAIRRDLTDREREAGVLDDLAFTYFMFDDYSKAADWYEQTLSVQRALQDEFGEMTTLDRIGSVYQKLGRREAAIRAFERLLAMHRARNDRAGEVSVLNDLAYTYNEAEQYEKSIDYYTQVLAIRREQKDREGEASALWFLGSNTQSLRQFSRAIDYYDQDLAIRGQLGDRAGMASTLGSLALVYEDLGEPDKATGLYDRVLAIRRDLGDRPGQASALVALGRIHLLSDSDKAIADLEQALAIQREIRDRSGEGKTLNLLGVVQAKLGHYTSELGYYEQALAIAREAKNRLNEGLALLALGSTHMRVGQHETAVEYLQQGLTIGREEKNRALEATALGALGVESVLQGQLARAVGYFEQAGALARAAGNLNAEALQLSFQAMAYSRLNRADEARACLERALANAQETKDPLIEANALIAQGVLFIDAKQWDKASAPLERALAIAREVGSRDLEQAILAGLMKAANGRGQPRIAIVYGKKSINIVQEIRHEIVDWDQTLRKSFLAGRKSVYRQLADLLAAQGRLGEAQEVLDLLKEDEFSTFVTRDRNVASEEGSVTLTAQEAAWEKRYLEISDRLAALGTRRRELMAMTSRSAADEQALTALDADLETGNRAFQRFLSGVESVLGDRKSAAEQISKVREAEGLMETLRELGDGSVAVYTIVGEQGYRSILITPDIQKGYSYSITAADLNRKILAFRERVRNPASDPRPLGKELYDILVKPMEGDLEGAQAQTIMWSLDGALRYVPIAALYDGQRYLVERFRNVVFTPASQSRLKDPVSPDWRGLGVGVSLAHDQFQALPNVPHELQSIINADANASAGVLSGTVKLDGDFTLDGFRTELRKHYSVVHVASHFDFSPGVDGNSFLLLGDGGRLTLEQFRSMPQLLQGVELLTLSACDTAVGGEDADGREVEGFAVLAQRQGAKAVVATLWAVADESTALLMREFYRLRMSDPRITKAGALRQAQLALLYGKIGGAASADRGARAVQPTSNPSFVADPQRPYAHPYFWAPFLLMGNWK